MVITFAIGDAQIEILVWYSAEDFAFVAEIVQKPEWREIANSEEEAVEKLKTAYLRNCISGDLGFESPLRDRTL